MIKDYNAWLEKEVKTSQDDIRWKSGERSFEVLTREQKAKRMDTSLFDLFNKFRLCANYLIAESDDGEEEEVFDQITNGMMIELIHNHHAKRQDMITSHSEMKSSRKWKNPVYEQIKELNQ